MVKVDVGLVNKLSKSLCLNNHELDIEKKTRVQIRDSFPH
jgi:hypothetical protein